MALVPAVTLLERTSHAPPHRWTVSVVPARIQPWRCGLFARHRAAFAASATKPDTTGGCNRMLFETHGLIPRLGHFCHFKGREE